MQQRRLGRAQHARPGDRHAVVCAALAAAVQARAELAVWMVLVPAGVLLATVDLTAARLPTSAPCRSP